MIWMCVQGCLQTAPFALLGMIVCVIYKDRKHQMKDTPISGGCTILHIMMGSASFKSKQKTMKKRIRKTGETKDNKKIVQPLIRCMNKIKVVGNVYDNPELLKGGER